MTTLPTAFVTGAPGWLGTRLCDCLIHGLPELDATDRPPGRRVVALVRPGSDTAGLKALGPSLEVIEGDLRNPEELGRFLAGGQGGTVFHCAGVIHPSRGVKEFYEVNARGTSNLLAAAEAAGIRRFVHMSSNSPLGCNRRPDEVFDERAPFNPYMHYGKSKMQGEIAVNEAGARGRLQTVIVRSPWFYGPNQPDRQSLFFRMIRLGKFPLVGGGENRRSMAYIDNIVQGLLLAERVDKAAGGTYWIADRRPYSMNEILSTVEEVMEKHFGVTPARKRVRLPGLASQVAQLTDASLQAAGLYHQKIHVLSEMNKTISCTVARAESELGYRPKVDLAEGMRRSLAWMRERGISW
jgi:nucleoside-diphosphate-sugar epimerase